MTREETIADLMQFNAICHGTLFDDVIMLLKQDAEKIQHLEEEVAFLKSMQRQMVGEFDEEAIGNMVAKGLGLRR